MDNWAYSKKIDCTIPEGGQKNRGPKPADKIVCTLTFGNNNPTQAASQSRDNSQARDQLGGVSGETRVWLTLCQTLDSSPQFTNKLQGMKQGQVTPEEFAKTGSKQAKKKYLSCFPTDSATNIIKVGLSSLFWISLVLGESSQMLFQ